jgi:type I restriction enzyme M protein
VGVPASLARTEMRSRYFTRAEAQRIGWNVEHPERHGDFLEEHELVRYLPQLRDALNRARPDFVVLGRDRQPRIVIECKAEASQLDQAVREAIDYATAMSLTPGYDVRLATGVAGTPDKRVLTKTAFRVNGHWTDLSAHGFPLTQIPTPGEAQRALDLGDGTTDVQLPDEREFFDAAVQISNILRLAKIEESRRPVVVGAIILALWQGEFSPHPDTVLSNINTNVAAAIEKFDGVSDQRRRQLRDTLRLGPEAESLTGHMDRVINQLERLNVRSIMRSGVDFLGKFYETFLRYGSDTKKMGIVFTPRHITRFCADLLRIDVNDTVYDAACGTGGFLVAAFDRMLEQTGSDQAALEKARASIFGCDTNSTVWALAMLNMFFRGDGKSHIDFKSAFDEPHVDRFTKALLNPPFSQEGEPEIDFIDHVLASLKTGGTAAIVVKTNIVVDPDLAYWRKSLVASHQVLASISLPAELFYPTAAPTTILVIKAHSRVVGQKTLLAAIRNDGFEISKKRRVQRDGSQLPDLLRAFYEHVDGLSPAEQPGFYTFVDRRILADGDEICAERWLPSAPFTLQDYERERDGLFRQMALAVANFPEAVDVAIEDFSNALEERPDPLIGAGPRLTDWFNISNGRSSGKSKYPEGEIPYISSGDAFNSIVELVEPPESEIYKRPRATITAFGQAAVQPWQFCARGNGGSAVRVLEPARSMTTEQLFWLVGQVNAQRWRFNYGRMATKGRLETMRVTPPPADLRPIGNLAARVKRFRAGLRHLTDAADDAQSFNVLAKQWREDSALFSTTEMMLTPEYLRIIGMGERAIPLILEDLRSEPDHWFAALNAITGENPVPRDKWGRVDEMASAWISWGERNGYL